VAVDSQGNVYLTGCFQGSASFGGAPLASAGLDDIFLARFTPAGAHLWSKRFGGVGEDWGYVVTLDSADRVYLSGHFSETVSFGGVALTSLGENDGFLASFSSAGLHRWSGAFAGGGDDRGLGLRAGSGRVVVTGYFGSKGVDLGSGKIPSTGGLDLLLASYALDGQYAWSAGHGGTLSDLGRGIALDGDGNIYVGGQFASVSLKIGETTLASQGDTDTVLMRVDPGGRPGWARAFGGPGNQLSRDLVVDGVGRLFVVGCLEQSLTFDSHRLTSQGAMDIYVASLDSNGAVRWARRFGGPGEQCAEAVALDGAGNLYVTGYFEQDLILGGRRLTSHGGRDIFVASFDAAGNHRWSASYGGSGDDTGTGVALSANGRVHVAGTFVGTMDLGGGALTSASADVFLLQLAQ